MEATNSNEIPNPLENAGNEAIYCENYYQYKTLTIAIITIGITIIFLQICIEIIYLNSTELREFKYNDKWIQGVIYKLRGAIFTKGENAELKLNVHEYWNKHADDLQKRERTVVWKFLEGLKMAIFSSTILEILRYFLDLPYLDFSIFVAKFMDDEAGLQTSRLLSKPLEFYILFFVAMIWGIYLFWNFTRTKSVDTASWRPFLLSSGPLPLLCLLEYFYVERMTQNDDIFENHLVTANNILAIVGQIALFFEVINFMINNLKFGSIDIVDILQAFTVLLFAAVGVARLLVNLNFFENLENQQPFVVIDLSDKNGTGRWTAPPITCASFSISEHLNFRKMSWVDIFICFGSLLCMFMGFLFFVGYVYHVVVEFLDYRKKNAAMIGQNSVEMVNLNSGDGVEQAATPATNKEFHFFLNRIKFCMYKELTVNRKFRQLRKDLPPRVVHTIFSFSNVILPRTFYHKIKESGLYVKFISELLKNKTANWRYVCGNDVRPNDDDETINEREDMTASQLSLQQRSKAKNESLDHLERYDNPELQFSIYQHQLKTEYSETKIEEKTDDQNKLMAGRLGIEKFGFEFFIKMMVTYTEKMLPDTELAKHIHTLNLYPNSDSFEFISVNEKYLKFQIGFAPPETRKVPITVDLADLKANPESYSFDIFRIIYNYDVLKHVLNTVFGTSVGRKKLDNKGKIRFYHSGFWRVLSKKSKYADMCFNGRMVEFDEKYAREESGQVLN